MDAKDLFTKIGTIAAATLEIAAEHPDVTEELIQLVTTIARGKPNIPPATK